ncbi:MAG TPA: hypothetical protein PKC49_04260 [Phycisphaerae bacterium]|nr:hypothetical protein [Phycisphaerae bacterium]
MYRLVCLATLLPPVALTAAGGCAASSTRTSDRLGVSTRLSKEELGELLQQFEDAFEATIREAAERITTRQPDRRTRRLALLWQMRLFPLARDALNQQDAVHSLLDAWALCVRLRDFFEQGDGRELFGEQQAIAQGAARRSLLDVERIAALVLTPQGVERARPAIEDLAHQYPLRGEFSGSVVRSAIQRPEKNADVIASILTAPIAPFRAFEGIDRGAAAIQGFTAVAARMTDTVNDLPESVRLQTELLLMELEELETVEATRRSFQKVADSSSRLAAAAETLPDELRKQLTLAADELEHRQAALGETLRQAQDVASRVREALERAESAAVAVRETAGQAAAAGDSWAGAARAVSELVASFRGGEAPSPPPGREPSGPSSPTSTSPAGALRVDASAGADACVDTGARPFDVQDYTAAAQALDRAALQIQDLARDIRELTASPELAKSLDDTEARARPLVDSSHASATALVDHLAWRGAQLIGLLFVALLAQGLLLRMGPKARPRAADAR